MLNKGSLRGFLIALFFAIVLFALIPAYVQRPSFIPGFAPPPDMWPRTVSWLGLGLGLLAMAVAALEGRRGATPEPSAGALARAFAAHRGGLVRLALALAAFGGFVALAPRIGFLVASMLLALSCFLLAGATRRPALALGLAFALPLGLQFFFAHVTHTPFPQGDWGVVPALP